MIWFDSTMFKLTAVDTMAIVLSLDILQPKAKCIEWIDSETVHLNYDIQSS